PRAEGPVAVPEEVAGHGDAEGADRGDRVEDAEVAGEEGEDAEVDQVAGAADDAELEQLEPAVAAAGGGAETDDEGVLRVAHRLTLPLPPPGAPRARAKAPSA